MSFTEPVFFLFLGVLIVAFNAVLQASTRWALLLLLGASIGFYAYREPAHLPLLIGVTGIAFLAGRLIVREDRTGGDRWVVGISIGLLLLPLLVFKYLDFILLSVLGLESAGAWSKWIGAGLILPLGISFFTFQNIGYVVDRYRGQVGSEKNAEKYAVYILFFPQLVAGPIVAARDFLPQLMNRTFFHNRDFILGGTFLLLGYCKKALLADSLAAVVDPAFANAGTAGGVALWIAVVAYAMQIYFDFSGYSDIAIGVGLWFGFRLPENFDYPYSAGSFRDFWRRWHMTLSRWLRDQLYIPMGGSRHGAARMYFALFATMALGGLWHGAHWNFLIWGMGHGALLILERWIPERWRTLPVFAAPYRILVLACIVLLWIPFRAGSESGGLALTGTIFERLFTLVPGEYSEAGLRVVVGVLVLLGAGSLWGERLFAWWNSAGLVLQGCLLAAGVIVLICVAPGGSGFIYFVF